ncbi:protein GUCD1 isoform X1 [Dendrobium catenatum]|uniref:protein GUCD1 isoform X1 n=2 Tax=Dendrobium catenatum TaxID=906689 RepID=UPI0009F447F7|nr:protein GUCD1 isoform X1 [Dendrobium catenatum]XP_020678925.1 protein GUCD1 isoform X1 [Dendrobium catenatum]XP_020678926.1 protein GUCD1 isoform X1 [Dendrobium catenatum]
MEGPRGRNWRAKFSMHILITLCFAVCLIFNSEKLPLVDLKIRVCGILETEDAQHVGRFSKLSAAGLVMWPICFIADRLIKMLGEGKIGAKWCDAALARSNGVDASATFPASSHFVDVPHVRQQFHWDCGLACVLMVLRTVGIGHIGIHELVDLCSTTSVWTVDLAYLLKRFSISFHFFTVTIGANPNFSDETFYREQLKDDVNRVDGLFEKALETGIVIECRSINGVDIAALISSGQYIAVALVDKIKLSQSQQKDGFFSVGSSDYMGHFIVICGYDAEASEFEIRDPASSRKNERVSLECLDCARKCYGTDEDIILVSLKEKPHTISHLSC